jgi:uncharacterized membrane protein SpoIIM required for sporulation
LPKLIIDYYFWITFILGAVLGSWISLVYHDNALKQSGKYFSEIFANNLKIAFLIVVTGILTNKILPYLILFFNGVFWGLMITYNMQIIGVGMIFLLCLHVPFELLGFSYSFHLSEILHDALFQKNFQFQNLFSNSINLVLFLSLAGIMEFYEFYLLRSYF